MKHEAERKITKSKTITVARALADLANLTNESYIILDVDHTNSNRLRVAEEFARLGSDVLDAVLEDNSAVIEFNNSAEALDTLLELEADLPTNTPTIVTVTLVRPFALSPSFTQRSGKSPARTTEGFTSNCFVD